MTTQEINIGPRDNSKNVAQKLNIDNSQMDKIMRLGESGISDKKMFEKVSKMIDSEKATLIMNWLGAEDFS